MPLDYRIDTSRRLVVLTVEGTLSKDEILNYQATVLNDPDFDPTFSRLSDVRRADLVGVYEDCIEALPEHAVPEGGSKSAIVVRDAIGTDLMRTLAGLREGMGNETRLFRDLDSGTRWLEREVG